MLKEIDYELERECQDAVQEISDNVMAIIEDSFENRYVPLAYKESDEYLVYMADTLFHLRPKARMKHPLYKETEDIIHAAVCNLSPAEDFAIQCNHIELTGRTCTQEEIEAELMKSWLSLLRYIRKDRRRKDEA